MQKFTPPYLGAAYYPEDWPLEQIDADIELMKQAGLNAVRVGEFAWSRMEPREGSFDFKWLHLAVDKLGAAGIATILCTPTCTPPAWLSERYPEILLVTAALRRREHGGRRHACPTQPVYRGHCARIVTRLAGEFGSDPNVIGWQIDNELYMDNASRNQHGGCFCQSCRAGFAAALRDEFGTVEKLNAAWGTGLWSQTYDSFEQIAPPDGNFRSHPSLESAWMRYQSDCYVDFARHQADLLHRIVRQPVGTDMMPFGGLHYEKMHRSLDLVMFNHYHRPDNLWEAGFWMDHIRTLKPVPFWNTETSTCWNGGTTAGTYREPGFCRANSWMPVALGGEANLYWLWRSHWSGQECMHGSVVSSAGRPLHIFGEVREAAEGFRKASAFINGTRPVNTGLALHFSFRAWWLFNYQPLAEKFDYREKITETCYHPLIRAQLRPDVLDPAADLAPYRLVFSPYLPALDEAGLRERLKAWIEAGGTWVAGPLTDIRTMNDAKFTHAPYGTLEQWGGVYCRYEIPGSPRDFNIRWADGRESQGSVWYDALEPRGADPLAVYAEGPMKGLAAATRRRMGKGQVITLATMPRQEELQKLLLDLAGEAGVPAAAQASPDVLVVPRRGPAGTGMIAVEVGNKPGEITLAKPAWDLLTQERREGRVALEPYGVMVLREI